MASDEVLRRATRVKAVARQTRLMSQATLRLVPPANLFTTPSHLPTTPPALSKNPLLQHHLSTLLIQVVIISTSLCRCC
jgi:hypothetical protein